MSRVLIECKIMEIVFYLGVLICCFIEIGSFSVSERIVNAVANYKATKQASKGFKIYLCFQLFYWAVCMLGLFTFQWYLFLFIIFLSFFPFKSKYVLVKKIDSLFHALLLGFIIINKYHLHLSLKDV